MGGVVHRPVPLVRVITGREMTRPGVGDHDVVEDLGVVHRRERFEVLVPEKHLNEEPWISESESKLHETISPPLDHLHVAAGRIETRS